MSMSTFTDEQFEETIMGYWQLDPQRSKVEFRARHFWGLLTVSGDFADFAGHLDLGADPAIELTIEADSLRTGNAKRDRHLRSADFFDAENHPRIRFLSDSVEVQGDTLRVHGALSARGGSIPIELTAQLRSAGDELEIEAATMAQHSDLGMDWSPLGMIRPCSELLVTGRLVRRAETG